MPKRSGRLALFILIVLCLIPQVLYAQNDLITVADHILCKQLIDGQPVNITQTFKTDDRVFSWLRINGALKGDKVTWLFQRSGGPEVEKSLTLGKDGEQSISTIFDLNQFSNAEVAGKWTVTILFNGKRALTDDFTVEPLTGLVWWGPIAGALLFMFIGFLILSVIVLLIILLIKRKDIAGRRQ